jgi:hypothetical protein
VTKKVNEEFSVNVDFYLPDKQCLESLIGTRSFHVPRGARHDLIEVKHREDSSGHIFRQHMKLQFARSLTILKETGTNKK